MADPSAAREPARFEYRVWSEGLNGVTDRLRTASDRQELVAGSEIYLVSRQTAAINPKVRDRLLDVKVLVDEVEGFQRWDVHSKTEFPLESAAVDALVDLLEGGPVTLDQESYTLDELIAEVIDPDPALLAVRVTKQREMHTIGACRAEITSVELEGSTYQTVAIESADLSELADLRASLGLEVHRNTSYPSAILEALGDREVGHGN